MAPDRLFFALWPTSSISTSIKSNTTRLKKTVKGKFVTPENWHITLAFLGNVDKRTKDCLINKAAQLQCAAFELEFENVMYFKKTHILSYGVHQKTDLTKLNFLVDECKRVQHVCGLKSEGREFKPHITVARKVKELNDGLIIDPILWQANEFVLVRSELLEQGSVYNVLERWPLKVSAS